MARMSLQTAFDQVRQWLETNDLDRAIGMVHHILETYPHCLEAHQMLGEAHLSNRQYEEARAHFERVLQFDPEHIPALVGLGMTCERLGQLERAISAFERALEIKPDLPELRSQLLRLYTDAWGSEYAHLRLSRAGLARLYAKGHMLPQAISEFRQVVADQPDRLDSRVALAEVLWRDEQEEEAADVCRDILAKHPHVLKANLILGYIELAAGNLSGEQFWKAAAAIDPYQGMARVLFESLPPVTIEEPTLPEWDEAEWFHRQVTAPAEQLAATRSMEATTPTAVAAPPSPPAPLPAYADSDDFLASLLAIDAAPPIVSHPTEEAEVGISSDTRPFTLEELGLSEAELAGLGAPEEAPSESSESESSMPVKPVVSEEPPDLAAMQPFSLDELGLSPDEIAALNSASASAAADQPPPDLAAMQPFSLDELGLSPDEIASLSGETIITTPEPSQLDDIDFDTQPFSLDEIDFEGGGRIPTAGRDIGSGVGDVPPDLQPFSIEELEIGSMSGQADLGELPPSLQPFSLEEPPAPQRPRMAGLTPEEAAETPIEEEDTFLPRGFSWQQPSQRTEPSFFQSTSAASTPDTGTIFSKLQKQRESAPLPRAEEPPAPPIAPDEHLGLFSLDDVSLRDDESLESGALSATVAPHIEAQWQSLVPPAHAERPTDMAHISTPPGDSGQTQAISLEETESIESAIASGVIQPFSFVDLGLTAEEIAALGLSTTPDMPGAQEEIPETPAEIGAATQEEPPAVAASSVEPPVTPPAREQAPPPLEEVESIEVALSSGQIQPFSFTDLGLSEEEIAALGLGDLEGFAQPSVSFEPETLEEPSDIEMFEAPPRPEPSAELSTGAGETPAPETAAEPVVEEALGIEELQPFSLDDLGLSEEELAEFDLSSLEDEEGEHDEGRLGITEEELAALGTGGDLAWVPEPAPVSEPSATTFAPMESAPEVSSGDEVVDRLIQIGHERGYVDIADIIAAVKDPEAEAARIDEIGRMLHAARIEIRDGDEVIDLDAEYADEEAPLMPEGATPAANAAEEEDLMRPFSLEELGLSDDEIAMLAAAAASRGEETPSTLAEETPLPPFSLEEAGAADDEIAMIAAASSGEEAPPAAAEEPLLTPFSLEELGLSEDEIALLNETAASLEAPPPPAASIEAETTAWFDLEPVVADAEAAASPESSAPDMEETQPPAPPKRIEPAPAPAPPKHIEQPPAIAAAKPPAPPPAPSSAEISSLSDYPELQEYLNMLETNPDNHLLRLSIARFGSQAGMAEIAMQHYRRLIKQNALLDEIVDDLTDMIAETSDANLLRKLHRTLGDAYSRQGRFRDAMREYSWIPGQA
ncbi:tetratricopeptide repeat protein [Roseiflexus castenholzii]|uniref:tetratricopeptide repeat protein n=1 Tax=Roseiflexus castenholzii TaxID=120962 RepID=UPI003C7B347A